jgi:hypothetical protein
MTSMTLMAVTGCHQTAAEGAIRLVLDGIA